VEPAAPLAHAFARDRFAWQAGLPPVLTDTFAEHVDVLLPEEVSAAPLIGDAPSAARTAVTYAFTTWYCTRGSQGPHDFYVRAPWFGELVATLLVWPSPRHLMSAAARPDDETMRLLVALLHTLTWQHRREVTRYGFLLEALTREDTALPRPSRTLLPHTLPWWPVLCRIVRLVRVASLADELPALATPALFDLIARRACASAVQLLGRYGIDRTGGDADARTARRIFRRAAHDLHQVSAWLQTEAPVPTHGEVRNRAALAHVVAVLVGVARARPPLTGATVARLCQRLDKVSTNYHHY
jgi:hypothetical protein